MGKQKEYIPDIFDKYDQGEIVVDNHKLVVRYLPHCGRIDFGMGVHFDRWANSTDFSTTIPKTEKQWEKKLFILSKKIEQYWKCYKDKNDDWHDHDRWV